MAGAKTLGTEVSAPKPNARCIRAPLCTCCLVGMLEEAGNRIECTIRTQYLVLELRDASQPEPTFPII